MNGLSEVTNTGNTLRPGLNAHRRPQSPIRPPNYEFSSVPKCNRNMDESVIQAIQDHKHFKECMAEMVLLCNEAIRRSSAKRDAGKPLSLEYIADRLDVDDPCFGFLARSKEGKLQGFITVTTFTNWQKSFRWDSLNDASFFYDGDDETGGVKRERKVDRDGKLAQELGRTVRMGNPYDEGIVWPRIAEISLLGALGCGKALVQLVIEKLEFQKPSASANYDYIVLQATDNSISFYESLGFVRVGAVTFQDNENKESSSSSSTSSSSSSRSESPVSTASEESVSVDAVPLVPSSPDRPDSLALPSEIVSNPLTVHEVKKAGETPFDIAQRYSKVDPWDIVFLNKELYPDLAVKSRLKKGTTLYVPKKVDTDETKEEVSPTRWFVAKENDTPRKIAKIHGIACNKLVLANRNRLPELQASSRLKAGTPVKISNLDQIDEVCQPYCHWSFPDDTSVENGEPSYMMVYKIRRKNARSPRNIRDSLAVPISDYSPPEVLLEAPKPKLRKLQKRLPPPPLPPPKPPTGMNVFMDHQRQLHPELRRNTPGIAEILNEKWRNLSSAKQERYENVAADCSKHFQGPQDEYKAAYSKWQDECAAIPEQTVVEKEASLFSKVVKLREDAIEGKNYTYWFVLTYIPDLKWCHLAPMVQDGVFGPERKKSEGRPKWRLVDESLGHELDISSMYCIPVRSKALRKTADADKEEWDVLDGYAPQKSTELKSSDVLMDIGQVQRKISKQPANRSIKKQPIRPRSATKPMGGKIAVVKPIHSEPVNSDQEAPPVRSPIFDSSTKEAILSSVLPARTPVESSSPTLSPLKKRKMSNENFDPARKARKINYVGTMRSVLQS